MGKQASKGSGKQESGKRDSGRQGPGHQGDGQEQNNDASVTGIVGVSAGVVALFLVLRIMAISHWDWNTAGRVLDAFDFSDSASIVAGTVFSRPDLAGWMLGILTPFVLVRLVWHRHRKQFSLSGVTLAVLCVAMLLSVAFSARDALGLILAAVLLVALIISYRMDHEARFHKAVHWLVERSPVIALIGALVLAVVVDNPWASRETFTLSDGSTQSGYVLNESPSGLHVLNDQRQVEVLLNRDVVDRVYN